MRSRTASQLARALLAAVAAALVTAGAAAEEPGAEVDTWLAAHPNVASAIIWEFPPPRPRTPLLVHKPILWLAPSIDPAAELILPMTDSVFPEPRRGETEPGPLDPTPRLDEALRDPDAGEPAPARALAAQGPGGTTPFPTDYPLPPDLTLPGGVKTSEYGAEIRAWSRWPEWARAELRARFADARAWSELACPLYDEFAASGFTIKPVGFDDAFSTTIDVDPLPVIDPPINIQPDDPAVEGVPWAKLSSSHAFALFVRNVAAQLALEITGCLPWSMTAETALDLRVLLDGRKSFRYVPKGPSQWGEMTATGHIVATTVTPAPPLIVLGFLAQNGLIGADRTETVLALLSWEREHLRHVVSGALAVPLAAGELYFGYNGRAPVSRMINGTVMAAPLQMGGGGTYFDPQLRHWVGGCGGASGFNQQVLRAVNIAADKTAYGHFQNRFSLDGGVHAGIGHADDPYGIRSAPEIPIDDLLIDDATFKEWFVDEPDPALQSKNVSRRAANLYLAYLPQVLLDLHCQDTVWFGNDHASSMVYGWSFKSVYSVQELEALGLWTGIEAKLAALGGCSALGY